MDLALNNLQRLICHKTQRTNNRKTVKKTRNGNLLVVVENRRQAENIKNKNVSYDEMQSVPA